MKGLTEREVKKKQAQHGLNLIKRQKQKTKLQIISEIVKDPIIIIMFSALVLTIITNWQDQHFSEAYVILSLIMLNLIISYVQEVKTITKLRSLEKLNEDMAIVIRNGKQKQIEAKGLVCDDIVILKLGDIARADLEIIEAKNLQVDESFLTGESELVKKDVTDVVFSNSPIQDGNAIARVVAIGMDTQIGQILDQVTQVEVTKSQLELKILHITKLLMKLAFAMAIIIFVLAILNGQSLDMAFAFLISILIATVPEGLATVLTIVLTFMASKMARNNALVKKVNLLESLGEVSYVCSDKTGTITENKMKVAKKKFYLHEPEVTALIKQIIDMNSPTTKAISEYINSLTTLASDQRYKLLDELPFNSRNKYSLYLLENEIERVIVAIGAPEVLVNREHLGNEFIEYANDGLRTIVVAGCKVNHRVNLDIDITEINLMPLCLFGIQDPPKASAVKTIQEFNHSGISPVMITGDSKETAMSIAKQTGIVTSHDDLAITHEELIALSDEEFEKKVKDIKVYARAKAEDKVRIVRALQKKGKIVAMMGDGTNDSIALRQADVGIAMGINGTDISKDAADLILLDDDYSTIDIAIHGGRLIFANLRKFVRQMLTSNTAHSSTIMFALIFGLFANTDLILPMTPILILWINIVSDAIPCLALGLDSEESNLMENGPIDPDANILTKPMIIEILIRGMTIGLLVLIGFTFTYNQTGNEQIARTIGFVILSFGQLVHIFDARTNNTLYKRNPFTNKWLLLAVAISSVLNLLLIYTPLNVSFGLEAINLSGLIIAIIFSTIPTFIYSLIKLIYIEKKY